MHRDFSNQFVFYLLPYYIYLSSSVGSGRFITLVTVKRTGDKSGYATAEWIWSDLFAWISYDLAHERCLDWIQKEPNPKVYTGRRRFHKIATYHLHISALITSSPCFRMSQAKELPRIIRIA